MRDEYYGLEDAILVPSEFATTKPRRARHGTWFPEQLETRLSGAPAIVWSTMHCLLWLELKAWTKGEPIAITNIVAKRFGIPRKQKRRALDELVKRGVVSYTQKGRGSPEVEFLAK